MAKKNYVVRDGYGFQAAGKDYAAGEIIKLDEEVGSVAHQLEEVVKDKPKAATPPADEPAAG